jgi:hypothetical protein
MEKPLHTTFSHVEIMSDDNVLYGGVEIRLTDNYDVTNWRLFAFPLAGKPLHDVICSKPLTFNEFIAVAWR